FSPWNRGVPGGRYLPPSIAGVIPRSRASFPLGLGHAAQYVAPRVALIGDAAHRTHPLAGQGVNLGFGDVVCLRDSVQDSVRLGCDVGELSALRRYESVRQRHNASSLAAIHALFRLYSTHFAPIVLLRSIGLSTIDAIGPIKVRGSAWSRR
ncbi:UNVERIFIED_CONTAM: hypothetical protein GTU68_057684, partial [Idotea baltica]|nr:hypothetical protein [Idotea baltica]